MAENNSIEYLNQSNVKGFYEALPKMVIAHSKRVMNIAKFLVKRFETEDFFFDLHINQTSFLDACLYHDVGKSGLPQEYLFRELCTSPFEVHKYMEHVNYALEIIDDDNIDKYVEEHPNNFKTYFYQTVRYHHGPTKSKFPITGQIAYVADMIDTSCFKVASNSVVELDDKSFNNIWNKLLEIFNRDGVHIDMLRIFKEERFIQSLNEFLDKLYKKTTQRTRYGLTINDYNIYDIFRLDDASNVKEEDAPLKAHALYARKITYNINTRYYGKILHDEFIYVALKNKFAKKLDSAFFTYVEDKLKECYDDAQILTFINFTVDSVNKITVKRILKIADKLCIPHSDICILMDLYYDELTDVQKTALKELKVLGFRTGINQARAEYINIFNEFNIDYAFYDNASTAEVDEIFMDLVQSLGTKIILNEKGIDRYRYIISSDANFRRNVDEEENKVEEEAKKNTPAEAEKSKEEAPKAEEKKADEVKATEAVVEEPAPEAVANETNPENKVEEEAKPVEESTKAEEPTEEASNSDVPTEEPVVEEEHVDQNTPISEEVPSEETTVENVSEPTEENKDDSVEEPVLEEPKNEENN